MQLLHPGVYVQEVPAAVKPIAGVGTSTAAFIGIADQGPVPGTLLPTGNMATPVLVTSFTDYSRNFGGFRTDSFLTYAVQGFFQNGGQALYIVRIYTTPSAPVPSGPGAVQPGLASASLASGAAGFSVSAASPGLWGNSIWLQIVASSDGDTTNNFRLLVMVGLTAQEAASNVVESLLTR